MPDDETPPEGGGSEPGLERNTDPNVSRQYEDWYPGDTPEIAKMGREWNADDDAARELRRHHRMADQRHESQAARDADAAFDAEHNQIDSVIDELQPFKPGGGTDSPPPASTGSGKKTAVIAGAAIAGLVVVGAAISVLAGGGDDEDDPATSTADEASEPANTKAQTDDAVLSDDVWSISSDGGWEQFDTFDEIPDRVVDGFDSAQAKADADPISMDVSSDGTSTQIGINHGGDAEAVEAYERSDYSVGVSWWTADGMFVDINYDDREVKISDRPSDWVIEALWERPDRLLFIIDGVGIVPGDVVGMTVFLELFGGINLQSVELTAG